MELHDKRVVVTGGGGFLGRHVVRTLRERGCTEISIPRRQQYDLTHEPAVERLYRDTRPRIVIHLAAPVGGIGAVRADAGRFLYETLVMGAMLMEYARRSGVEKFVVVGAAFAYPRAVSVPFREDDLWEGYPEDDTAPYALAKRMLIAQAQAYRRQYGFNAIGLLPVSLYGPGDNFDLETASVIPALIRKCIEAREAGVPEIRCWGDGSPERDFVYVEDCAEAIVAATERYDGAEPVNIGSGEAISIRELATLIAELTGYRGRIVFDGRTPCGAASRCVDVSRAERAFGFRATTGLRQGLSRTLAWHERAAIRRQFSLPRYDEDDLPAGAGVVETDARSV